MECNSGMRVRVHAHLGVCIYMGVLLDTFLLSQDVFIKQF